MCPKALQHFRGRPLHQMPSSQWDGMTGKLGPGGLGGMESAAISAHQASVSLSGKWGYIMAAPPYHRIAVGIGRKET